MVTITLALGAVIIRLSWAATFIRPVSSMVIIALCTVVTFGIYVLISYCTIKPSLKKLRSLPVRISVTIIITVGLISGIIHFIRFVPSPEAASPLSVVIASMLLMASVSAYPQPELLHLCLLGLCHHKPVECET